MPQLSGFGERALFDEILQVACGGRAGGLRDADIVVCAQAALESIDVFPKHAGQHFLLTLVQLSAQLLVQLRFGDVERRVVVER